MEWDIIFGHKLIQFNRSLLFAFRGSRKPPTTPFGCIICRDRKIANRCIKPDIEHLDSETRKHMTSLSKKLFENEISQINLYSFKSKFIGRTLSHTSLGTLAMITPQYDYAVERSLVTCQTKLASPCSSFGFHLVTWSSIEVMKNGQKRVKS